MTTCGNVVVDNQDEDHLRTMQPEEYEHLNGVPDPRFHTWAEKIKVFLGNLIDQKTNLIHIFEDLSIPGKAPFYIFSGLKVNSRMHSKADLSLLQSKRVANEIQKAHKDILVKPAESLNMYDFLNKEPDVIDGDQFSLFDQGNVYPYVDNYDISGQNGEEINYGGSAYNDNTTADFSWYYQQINNFDKNFDGSSSLTFIAPDTPPILKSSFSAHNGQVCSTWGNSYFKNFDGDIFHFPGTCNYLYASNCKSSFEEFNIQIRRSVVNSLPTISHIIMKIEGVFIEMTHESISFNGEQVDLPYSFSGVQADRNGIYIRIKAKVGLEFKWNEDDAVMLELDMKFSNQTCGLCGDFNGIPVFNEFVENDVKMTEIQFGNEQKLNEPTELCQDLTVAPQSNCTDSRNLCQVILTNVAFSSCNSFVDPAPYINACVQDLCRCAQNATGFCLCNTFTEYSRQCAHAGGRPSNWRTPTMCSLKCNSNLQYMECGSPCPDTCTNPDRSSVCESHCTDGCFCPEGTVFDDIDNSGCIPKQMCSCIYNGKVYSSGSGYSARCQYCTCNGGKWKCVEQPCLGSCSVVGGSHITSFDATHYDFHGDCSYVLTKSCLDSRFSVLGELLKCGQTDTETCLRSITLLLEDGKDFINIQPCGSIYVNSVFTQLPISSASVTIFKPSTFFIIVLAQVGVQLQIQLVPTMQVYIYLEPSYKNQVCGLCGNFNNMQADDFRVLSGVTEGTASSFGNTWKTQAGCSSVIPVFENPCTLSIENEQYATYWCSLISDPEGPFAECHSKVDPAVFKTNCMFDSCNCEKSEECMCAALSSYVHVCAREGVVLKEWRQNVCQSYTTTCPNTMTYSYTVRTCQPTCRSLSEPDITCRISFVPVDGCVCGNGTYLDDSGRCVQPDACSCFNKGTAISPGEVVYDNGAKCTCTRGKLDCIGKPNLYKVCDEPMIFYNCSNRPPGTRGLECQKSCETLDMNCYSTQCISGCMCPDGLINDGIGGCVSEDQCPCIHNNDAYAPGSTLRIACKTCTCENRKWHCTGETCLSTCAVYGDGHYLTFDSKKYRFNGDCQYTLAQDYCSDDPSNGTFRVITENIPCGTTGNTCSISIKLILGNYELLLEEEKFEVVIRDSGEYVPFKVHQMGIYLVIESLNGLVLVWDKKTSIYIKLQSHFKGKICGLRGNYDGNAINDFTTRSLSVVGDAVEFGNSWKLSPSCPDAIGIGDPCSANLYRKAWAEKQCSMIISEKFLACHYRLNPTIYYEACINDACACDTGGDCECLCTAIAAYAQACSEAGACVSWRSPSFCPVFCDYYNMQGHCEWHYKACGAPCMKTCRNPSGICYYNLLGLEGCYPKCPPDRPYFDEDRMRCVRSCCYDKRGRNYLFGQVMPREGVENECCCTYNMETYTTKQTIYSTTDGIGGCITATCENGTITRYNTDCSHTTTIPSTTFSFSTTPPSTTSTPSTTSPPTTTETTSTKPTTTTPPSTTSSFSTTVSTTTFTFTTSTPGCTATTVPDCSWSEWIDISYPSRGNAGDFETFENITKKGIYVCDAVQNIECRAEEFTEYTLEEVGQEVICDKDIGLICLNHNNFPQCYNYEIRICCSSPTSAITCTTSETSKTTSSPTTTVTTITSTPTTTTTESPTTTTTTTPTTTKTPTTTTTTTVTPTTSTTTTTTTSTTTRTPTTTTTESPTTTSSFSTTISTTTFTFTTSTPGCTATTVPDCSWSEWIDISYPERGNAGDFETFENITKKRNLCL
ncbi:mucin-5AC-like [Rhinophrynus dorsalis]